MTLTRAKLEELVDELVQKTLGPVKLALKDAKIDVAKVNEVVLVGGMTRMPKIQDLVKDFFKKEPHKGVNPDEVVAVGAAVQAGVITGDVKDILLLDVTPLTLGLETMGAVRTALIPRNTTVPTSKSQTFSTASDNQTSVEINVLQGEREMAADNKSLGKFILDGIPPAPRGVPQVDVTFDIDANGILHVSAKDKTSGKEQKISIQNSTNISKEEVERMKAEAEKFAEDDRKKKETVESRNKASSVVFELEKQLKDYGDKVDAADKAKIEENVKKLKELTEQPEATKEDLDKAVEETLTSAQKIGEAMQKAQQAAGAAKPESEPENKDDKKSEDKKTAKGDVQEGEVVEE